MSSHPRLDKLKLRVEQTASLSSNDLELLQRLFRENYQQANIAYLESSFEKLRYVAIATEANSAVGFGISDCIKTTLPRMDQPKLVALGGMTCIKSTHRRIGLFGLLQRLASSASGLLPSTESMLSCGRMAHPAGFRAMNANPTVVPKAGLAISEWQQEVGLFVAELYGVELDPNTFVVQGKGTPVGYPCIDIEVSDEEWRVFEHVDRDQGDSLLGIAWTPEAPTGW